MLIHKKNKWTSKQLKQNKISSNILRSTRNETASSIKTGVWTKTTGKKKKKLSDNILNIHDDNNIEQ